MSLPVRGAWIEISLHKYHSNHKASLPVRGAWIEIGSATGTIRQGTSLPVRGAWIEITILINLKSTAQVAPCEGSVD